MVSVTEARNLINVLTSPKGSCNQENTWKGTYSTWTCHMCITWCVTWWYC